jgi:hypothetical protein
VSITTDRQVLAQARAVAASRAGTPALGESGYAFYVAVLLVAVVAIPLVRALVLGLASPEVLGALISPGSTAVVGLSAAALSAFALLLGPIRGPVLPSPFLAEFLAGSGIARSSALVRPFTVTAAVVSAGAAVVAGISVAALLVGARAELLPAGLFVAGCVLFSTLLSVLWLIGQSCPRRITTPIAVGILVTAVIASAGADGVLLVTPWGWLALLWRSIGESAGSPIWTLVLLAAVPCVLLAVPRLLDNLRGSKLVTQSLRWQSIQTLVQTGDVAGAMGTLRAAPMHGRALRIRFRQPQPLATVQRDLVGALRFPLRLAIGSVALVIAGWLVAIVPAVPSGVQWLAALAGALLCYLAVGVWCDGIRNASENFGPASMYGGRDLPRIARHALVPGLAAGVWGSLGVVAACTGGARADVLWWWMALALFLVLVRVFDCAKGMMPISLLMPVPTPLGDLSILTVIAWQADAVLVVLVVGGGLTVLYGSGGFAAAAAWFCIAVATVAALAVRRIRMFSA